VTNRYVAVESATATENILRTIGAPVPGDHAANCNGLSKGLDKGGKVCLLNLGWWLWLRSGCAGRDVLSLAELLAVNPKPHRCFGFYYISKR
jgi:hypothetical protein